MDRSGRHVAVMPVANGRVGRRHIGIHIDVPTPKVVGLRIDRRWAAGARGQVFEQFNSRSRSGAQRRDTQPRAEHVVQSFLLDALIFAAPCDPEAVRVAVIPQARIRVGYHDRGMVYAEK